MVGRVCRVLYADNLATLGYCAAQYDTVRYGKDPLPAASLLVLPVLLLLLSRRQGAP